MKQFLRLWASYVLKRTQLEYLLRLQSLLKMRYILTGYVAAMLRKRTYTIVHYQYFTCTLPVLETRSSFSRTFFVLCSNFLRAVCGVDASRMRKNLTYRPHTACERHARWENKARRKAGISVSRLRKAQSIPCSSPPSLIFHPCDIRMIPVHISVKRLKYGTLPRSIRQTYGRNAHSDRQSVGQGSGWDRVRDRFGSASEVSLHSMQPCTALRLAAPNGVQSERKINPVEDQTKHPSHPEGDPVRRRSARRPLTARDWFEFSRSLVRQLFACASAFSRSVAEGLSKASRTLVEALSKDCRTSLEQQSNNCRRNIEESCVCTHAMAPARSGLGLALGLVLSLCCGIAKAQFHKPSEVTVGVGETLPESFFQAVHQAVNMRTGEETILRFEDYRDKLIILDFWATWCSPCIYSLNKLDTLGRSDGDGRYIVIPVTYQSIDEASRTYEKYGWHFNGIVGDTTLGKIFPHSGIPHMVWVKDGEVISMPQAAYVTRGSIVAALEGRMTDMPQQLKKVDTSRPVRSVSKEGYHGALFYQSTILGGDPAYGQLGFDVIEHDGYFVLTLCNMPMFAGLLYEAFRKELPANMARKESIVWDMDSISKAAYTAPMPRKADFVDISSYRKAYEAWIAKYMYTYSLKIPVAMGRESLYTVMQQDLCRFVSAHLGLEVIVERRPNARIVIRKSQSSI